jgi:hypothetical protein
MRIPRHWLLAIGGAALIASVAVFAANINSTGTALAGQTTADPTSEPTGEGTAEATTTQRPASTHTPTAEPTEPAVTEVPATEPPAPTTAPATSTPSGGSQGGGVAPPNTGFGDTGDSSSGLWVLLLGGALAAAGVGATAAGLRSR